jgi:hypothetical protein
MAATGMPSDSARWRCTRRKARGASARRLESMAAMSGVARKGLFQARGHLLAAGLVGAVDLGHQRALHRRAGRHLHHLQLAAVARRDGVELRAQALRDGVALLVAVRLVDQVDLQVTLLGVGAQVVLAHQAVEGDRAGGAGIALQVAHLGLLGQVRAQLVQRGGGVFQRRAGRHVQHELELALVVEGQHLQHHAQARIGDQASAPTAPSRPARRPAAAQRLRGAVQQRAQQAPGRQRGSRRPGRWARRVPASSGAAVLFISLSASQGVTVKAMASDIAMPRLELIGIGLMYGPIRPLTKAIGSSAAITVSVARMVGPPTSSTAAGMISRSGLPGRAAGGGGCSPPPRWRRRPGCRSRRSARTGSRG